MKRVIFAELSNERNSENGLSITFQIEENVKCGDFFQLKVEDKFKSFEAKHIKASKDGNLEVIAFEKGSNSFKLSKIGVDLRSLIGLEVSLIKDEEIIKNIRESSSWC